MSLPMKSGRVSTSSHLVPAAVAVNRALLRFAYLGARALWFVFRPAHEGAVVALWRGDRVVLVHQTYRRCWTFPGGGVEHGEAPEAAARREVREELGLELGRLEEALVCSGRYESRHETVHVYEAGLGDEVPRPDGIELDRFALLTAEEALSHDPPLHVRTYLLSRRAAAK
jgi:8-oxo-dGTP pyrophosphatase MutT (NUDIX family)